MTPTRRQFLAAAAAAAAVPAVASEAKAKVVMIAGTPSHPPGFHEFNAGSRILHRELAKVPGLDPVLCLDGYPKDESVFDGAAAIFCYSDGNESHQLVRDKRLKFIEAQMAKGVGLMCAHFAVEVRKDFGAAELRDWIGGCYEDKFSCNPMWTPEFKTFPDHPVTRGVKPFSIKDEWYFNMRFRDGMNGVTPLLTAVPSDEVRDGPYVYPKGPYPHIQSAKGKNQAEHMMWCVERADGGRGVGFTGGHTHRNWLDPNFRKVVLNALVWISKREVPAGGVESGVSEDDIRANLDPKPARK